MLNRRITRVVLNTTEVTEKANSINSDPLVLNIDETAAVYIGYHLPFASRYFYVTVANAVAATSLTVEYWNGSAWTAVDDLIDQTSSGGITLAQSGFISWQNPGDWQPSAQTGVDADVELYWIRLKVNDQITATTAVQAILNLFSDDNMLRAYYPELITDTRYLPASRTNFLEQHQMAKDLVVLRLKQRKVIEEEGQVIDVNEVAVAATHACAWMILNPIATSDETRAQRDDAQKNFDNEISLLNFSVDENKDGAVSSSERDSIRSMRIYRR